VVLCVVDTSAWVEALRVDGDAEARRRVAGLLTEGRACLTDMVVLELWNGARGEREKRELARLEAALPVLETSRAVWQLACDLARTCRSQGATVPMTDLLVYACSKHYEADLEQFDEHFDVIRRAAGR
jgi:predicted nucleic acid-binding protein